MDIKNLTVAVVYGGKSVEHEVSVHSAGDVCQILSSKCKVLPIFIDKKGRWFLQKKCGFASASDAQITALVGGSCPLRTLDGKGINVDVFFPVLHGTKGEDGVIQGLFEMTEIPYCGCGVLTSAAGMDKVISKTIAGVNGVPVLPHVGLSAGEKFESKLAEIKKLELPVFVKPVSLGSSVGVTKVKEWAQLEAAVNFAFKFDINIMIERGVDHAREIFCAVYGAGQNARVSPCGELIPNGREFFDYHSKYIDPEGCTVKVPAAVSAETEKAMREYSLTIFKSLRGDGLARVDFLLGRDGKFYFSEINTLPGLSNTSLFPQLWRAAGQDYGAVLEDIITAAVKRAQTLKKLQTDKD
ncbi:MAG: D-alanine--D-alanine ligase [Elusimicrobium sp.]|jgi:D-alanine-D-alanine ligase|nr:D-alanine--D-alanine ligase [Elusimicrobium sp.]